MLSLQQRPLWWHAFSYTLLCLVILSAGVATTHAQAPPSPPDSVRRMFGVGDKEFYKGAWIKIRPDVAGTHPDTVDKHWRQVWELADTLGIDVLKIQGHDFESFALTKRMIWARTDDTSPRQRLITSHVSRKIGHFNGRDSFENDFDKVSVGREVKFYPFTGRDSVEYRYWPSKFMTLSGGFTDSNASELDVYGSKALEQHYRRDSLSDSTVIARNIVFDYFPSQTLRWPQFTLGGVLIKDEFAWQNAHAFLAGDFQFNNNANRQFVVVAGHLFVDTTFTVPDTATVLKIEVIYEIPRGTKYVVYNDSNQSKTIVTAATDIERNLATLNFKKSQLKPGITQSYSVYKEAALMFNAAWCSDYTNGLQNTGPLYPGNESRRINLKVTWIGNEDLAIRSIALRDSIGQLVLGTSDTAGQYALFQRALLDARRGVRLNETGTADSAWPVIARSGPVESAFYHGAAFNRLQRLVRDSVRGVDHVHNDSSGIPLWNETDYNESLFQRHKENANPRFLVPEAVAPEIGIKTFLWLHTRMKIKNGRIPSISLHNGGRFFIPLLNFSTTQAGRDSIEHHYESTLQLLGLRQHIPYRGDQDMERHMHLPLGRAAETARDTRRRLFIVPFCVARLDINYNDMTEQHQYGVHTMLHIPEPAEMRTMVNLGLCYGARGVQWQVIEGQYNFMNSDNKFYDASIHDTARFGTNDDFGIHHPLARGPNLDVFPQFKFIESLGRYGYDATTPYATIDTFFTGWNIRTKSVIDIHRWIDEVGPHLMNLGWRDGYSIHFTVHQPYDTANLIQFRPLPTNEIINTVHARHPGGAARDSMHRTFVELGLFYKTNATGMTVNDVHHIFLVNRRCFERTTDIDSVTVMGRAMDTLAETRTIEVKLNLPHPDTTGYNFVRVQEIGCDTTRLPLSNRPRTPLDTIVNGDSTFLITLGPGRAALLRITYAPPTQSILLGDLRFSNQRKLLYDGRRYHAVFHRWNPADPAGLQDTIFYRRSIPVTDTNGYAGILWEPQEYAVSVAYNGYGVTRYENRFPSMTLRQFDGDTVVTVVWTCHSTDTNHYGTNEREIVARNICTRGHLPAMRQLNIEIVDWHKGNDPTQWGTPVICRADGGEFIAWSDSLRGIVTRFRARTVIPGYLWWYLPMSIYSPRDLVSDTLSSMLGGRPGKFPTVPAFAHIQSEDSICGIAWQQGQPASPLNEIRFRVLEHDSTTAFGLRVQHYLGVNDISVTGGYGKYYHPSMDQFQDFWQEFQNVVTFEQYEAQWYSVHMRSLLTETRDGMVWDTSGGDTLHNIQDDRLDSTFVWGWGIHQVRKSSVANQFLWPNIAALNQRASRYWAEHDTTAATIAYYSGDGVTDPQMYRSWMLWADGNFSRTDAYTWGGAHPMGSASTERQEPRYAALYRTLTSAGDTVGYTSRQFFARVRPTGYMSDGRSVLLRISDSLHTSITMQLNDVWRANDSGGQSVSFVPRGDSRARTDSLTQVHNLFRTEYFHATDSTLIGCSIAGRFTGDSVLGGSAEMSGVVELVDSATGNVTAQLDSFSISASQPEYQVDVEPTLDLLSGTYYVRMRLVSPALPDDDAMGDSRYPIAEVYQFVDNQSFGKLRRIDNRPQATARISASPNPFSAISNIRFSISKGDFVHVTVYDRLGREVTRLVDRTWMEAGRYEVTLENMDLEPGTYVIELRSGDVRTATKIVRTR
jgi:hypothetical protein